MFADNDSDSSTRPKPGREPRKKPRRRDFPSEQLTERNPEGMDFSPALVPPEIVDIEKMIETATPEQFQQLLALLLRKMMVRGLKDIPPPKSIKELQVLFTMFRQAEGIEARDRGGGAPPAGFLPRMIRRGTVGSMEAEIVPPETETGDDLFGSEDSDDEEFEI
jgi:hypothetical protein